MMNNTKFIVNEENRVVVAIKDRIDCKGIMEEVSKRCSNNTLAIAFTLASSDIFSNDLDIFYGNPFKAIAKCDCRDTFDREKGMEIAGSKLDMKYHKAMAKKYSIILNLLKNAIPELEILEKEHKEKADHIKNDIVTYYCEGGKDKE